jgi:hypothetical protein
MEAESETTSTVLLINRLYKYAFNLDRIINSNSRLTTVIPSKITQEITISSIPITQEKKVELALEIIRIENHIKSLKEKLNKSKII